MSTPILNRMGLLSPPVPHIEKKAQGCTSYCPLLIIQGRTIHQRFIKIEGNSIPFPPTDSLKTKAERFNSCTFKFLVTGLTNSSKHPQVEHQAQLPSYQTNEKV